MHAFLEGRDTAALFSKEALWRDYLAIAWDLQTHEGLEAINKALPDQIGQLLTILSTPSPDEIIFTFAGEHGHVKALAEINTVCTSPLPLLMTARAAPYDGDAPLTI